MTEQGTVSEENRNLGAEVVWAATDTADAGDEPEAEAEAVSPEEDGPDSRDAELRALNRELGRLGQRLDDLAASGSVARPGPAARLVGALRGLSRLWQARIKPDDDEKPVGDAPDSPFSRGPLVPFAGEDIPRATIAVTAFGLAREDLSKVLDTVEAYGRKRQITPVLLTDSDCFELFRQRRMVFEYLPPGALRDRLAPDMQWPLYFKRRLSLFRRKWRPAGIISFGKPPPVEDTEALLTASSRAPSD